MIEGDKKTPKGRINRVEVCFNADRPPYSEPNVLNDLIHYFGLASSFTPNVYITTCYGRISSDPSMFALARASILGMNLEKIVYYTFIVNGVSGILITQGE